MHGPCRNKLCLSIPSVNMLVGRVFLKYRNWKLPLHQMEGRTGPTLGYFRIWCQRFILYWQNCCSIYSIRWIAPRGFERTSLLVSFDIDKLVCNALIVEWISVQFLCILPHYSISAWNLKDICAKSSERHVDFCRITFPTSLVMWLAEIKVKLHSAMWSNI